MIRWALLLALAGVRLMIFDGNHKPSSKEIAERQPLRNRRGECRIRFVRPYWKLQPIVVSARAAEVGVFMATPGLFHELKLLRRSDGGSRGMQDQDARSRGVVQARPGDLDFL